MSRPLPESQITLKTVAGKKVEMKIPLNNPTESPIELNVSLEGNDLVITPGTVMLRPREELEYSVIYEPSKNITSNTRATILWKRGNIFFCG